MAQKIIGIVAHVGKYRADEILCKLNEEFMLHDVSMLFEEKTAKLMHQNSMLTVDDLAQECEVIVVLGGDGSLLRVLHEIKGEVPPIVGINLGSLGFLTCVSSHDFRKAVEAIITGKYALSHRSLLELRILRNDREIAVGIALNDIVVSRGETSRLIKLTTRIDGVPLTEYNADGLIIATPTGSTAYSLAAGGPILTPGSGVFVITPICPHVLTNRSIIVSDESLIEVIPRQDQREVFLALDGQEAISLTGDDLILIKRSTKKLPLVMLQEVSFFEVLRQKLKWSGTAIERKTEH